MSAPSLASASAVTPAQLVISLVRKTVPSFCLGHGVHCTDESFTTLAKGVIRTLDLLPSCADVLINGWRVAYSNPV